MSDAMALARAAEALVGTPFRFRGHDPHTGLDCIGLVAASLAAIGREPPMLPEYAMRNIDITRLLPLLPQAGFAETDAPAEPGDLLLLRPSSAQYHLTIAGRDALLIHAHAGLGRVVASPVTPLWAEQARWRLGPI